MTKVFSTRLCPGVGGSVEKPLSQCHFVMNATLYIFTLKRTYVRAKKIFKNDLPFQTGGQFTDFCFASFWFWRKVTKTEPKQNKNTFSKEFFQWNLAHNRRLSIHSHYWKKNGNSYSCWTIWAKYFFPTPNANLS